MNSVESLARQIVDREKTMERQMKVVMDEKKKYAEKDYAMRAYNTASKELEWARIELRKAVDANPVTSNLSLKELAAGLGFEELATELVEVVRRKIEGLYGVQEDEGFDGWAM